MNQTRQYKPTPWRVKRKSTAEKGQTKTLQDPPRRRRKPVPRPLWGDMC